MGDSIDENNARRMQEFQLQQQAKLLPQKQSSWQGLLNMLGGTPEEHAPAPAAPILNPEMVKKFKPF